MARTNYSRIPRREGVSAGSETLDILKEITSWSMTLGKAAQDKRDRERDYFVKYMNALTGDIDKIIDNPTLSEIEKKANKFYASYGGKEDYQIKELKDLYISKLESQKILNGNYELQEKEWGKYSQEFEDYVSETHKYTYARTAEDKELIAQNSDGFNEWSQEEYNNTEYSHKKYKKYMNDKMKDEMGKYGDFKNDFQKKFGHRISNPTWGSMEDTQYYMENIINSWASDGRMDKTETAAYLGMVQHGNKQNVKDLLKTKEGIEDRRMFAADDELRGYIKDYNNIYNKLADGYETITSDKMQSFFPSLGGDYTGVYGVANSFLVSYGDRKYLKMTDADLNKEATKLNTTKEILKKKGGISNALYLEAKVEEKKLKEEVIRSNTALEEQSIFDGLELYGFKAFDEDKERKVDALYPMLDKYQASYNLGE